MQKKSPKAKLKTSLLTPPLKLPSHHQKNIVMYVFLLSVVKSSLQGHKTK